MNNLEIIDDVDTAHSFLQSIDDAPHFDTGIPGEESVKGGVQVNVDYVVQDSKTLGLLLLEFCLQLSDILQELRGILLDVETFVGDGASVFLYRRRLHFFHDDSGDGTKNLPLLHLLLRQQ